LHISAQDASRVVTDLYLTEEKKAIAREYRLAAKKEKKKIKADAKRQRKLNAILHRRMVSIFQACPSNYILFIYQSFRPATTRNIPKTKIATNNELLISSAIKFA